MPLPLFAMTMTRVGWGAADAAMDESNKQYKKELRKTMKKALRLLQKEARNQVRSGTIAQTGNLLRRGIGARMFRNKHTTDKAIVYSGRVFYTMKGFYGRFLDSGFKHVGGGIVPGGVFMVHAVQRKGKQAERIVGGSTKVVAF